MNNEYIIINKFQIEKRIEELEEKYDRYTRLNEDKLAFACKDAQYELKQILSQSTPLIPEIEKAFDASKITTGMNQRNQFAYKYKTSQDYVSNLKLDI